MADQMSFAEKIHTINIGLPSRRGPKRTTVDTETALVTTTEHWSDRQDVTVTPVTPATISANKERTSGR